MSGSVAERKRLLHITAGNLRQNHIYIGKHIDFFPSDCVGPPKNNSNGHQIEIVLKGLKKTVETDIGSDKRTGKPRRFFRGRSWVREFFKHHEIKVGDVLALERISTWRYRLYPFDVKTDRESDWHELVEKPLTGKGPTVLDLFAGCGGMALGFKRAGFRTVLAVEWEASACSSLRANITDRVAQCAMQEIDSFPKTDIVVGGPPCQGFSNLGERVPNDPRNQLWRHFMRAVDDAQPKAFVLENVPPFLSSQEFIEIKKIAESLGYKVEGRILNAADFGVPQTRKRAFVVGVRAGEPTFPDPTHVNPAKRDLLTANLREWVTVRGGVGDLPFDPRRQNWDVARNPAIKSPILHPQCLERLQEQTRCAA